MDEFINLTSYCCFVAELIAHVHSFSFFSPEIPLFHVLNARVTFSNLCGCDEPVSSVTVHKPEGSGEAGNHCSFCFFGSR